MSKISAFLKLQSWGRRNAWWLLLGSLALGIAMALWGFHVARDYYFDATNKLRWSDAVYFSLQMIPLYAFGPANPDIPWQLNFARFWLPSVFFFAAGMSLLRVVGRKSLGLKRHLLKGHVIIFGHGHQACELARQHRLRQTPVEVLLISDQDGFPGQSELGSYGAQVVIDDPNSEDCLQGVNLGKAKAIYLVADQDFENLEVLRTLTSPAMLEHLKGVSAIQCFIHMGDAGLSHWISSSLEKSDARKNWPLRPVFFNAWENCARDLFIAYGPHMDESVRGGHALPAMLILGYNELAEQLILQAAKLGHYPGRSKLAIRVVAPDADVRISALASRFPALNGGMPERWSPEERTLVPLIELESVCSQPDSPPAELIRPDSLELPRHQVCFICLDDPGQAVRAVESIRAQSCTATVRRPPLKLVLCLPGSGSLLDRVIRSGAWLDAREIEADNLFVFDSLAYSCRLEKGETTIRERSESDAIAIYSFYVGREATDWHELTDSERDSNRQAADHLRIKARFLDRDDESLMASEHARWCAERLLAGWRYSAKKDNAQHLNPNLCPMADLPLSEFEKNRPIVRFTRETHSQSK